MNISDLNGMKLQSTPLEPTANKQGGRVKSVSSISDIAGTYVMSYSTLSTSYTIYGDGNTVTIAAIEGTDSVTISDFYAETLTNSWSANCSIKAKVDISTMTITIPNQVLEPSDTYSAYELAVSNEDGTPDRSASLTGTISDDGTISISSLWGVYETGSDSTYYGLYSSLLFELPNATMTCSVYNRTANDAYEAKSTNTISFAVIVTQVSDKLLTVKNFYNQGVTLEIKLRPDSVPKIEEQFIIAQSNKDYYLRAATATYSSSLSSHSFTRGQSVIGDAATDARTLSWGTWMITYSQGESYVYLVTGYALSSEITTTFDIKYPEYTALSLSGDGTESSPYQIGSAADWNTLATYIDEVGEDFTDKYVKLTADIDFTGSEMLPICYDHAEKFNGDLDGNGKTISGYTITTTITDNVAPICLAGSSAYIHDLTTAGTVTATNFSAIGGVVGLLEGKVENLVHKGTVTISEDAESDPDHVGGVVGYANAGTLINCGNEGSIYVPTYTSWGAGGVLGQTRYYPTITGCWNTGTVTGCCGRLAGVIGCMYEVSTPISDCWNKGTVTQTFMASQLPYGGTAQYTAGVVGYTYAATFNNCYNEGTVTSTGDYRCYLAGVVGYLAVAYSVGTYGFENCYNTADITGMGSIGGIYCASASKTVLTMDNCYNTGNITDTSESSSTQYTPGGIACMYCYGSTYTNCYNTGNVTSGTAYDLGGLFGGPRTDAASGYSVTISNCYNTGNVTGTSAYQVGGLVGRVTTYVTIDSCYNTGNVTAGSYYVGGIAGYLDGSWYSKISNCYNTGDITAGTNYAGGIVGYSASKYDYITACFNTGNVTATQNYAGGLAGYNATVTRYVYNTGNVTGKGFVGGLIGLPLAGGTTLEEGYSTGKVVAENDTCGNIIGVSLDNTSYWNSSNSMSSTYYLAANAVDCTDTISAALTYAQLAALEIGDNWTAGDNYTYPRLTAVADNDYAKAYAAAVIPTDGETYSSITQGFNVGTPDGVTWAASTDAITFDGNTATFTETVNGTITLTATCGDASATTEITCNVEVEGINDVLDSAREVVSEEFYTVSGTQVAEPSEDAKAIYIIVKTYDNGSTEVVKEVR